MKEINIAPYIKKLNIFDHQEYCNENSQRCFFLSGEYCRLSGEMTTYPKDGIRGKTEICKSVWGKAKEGHQVFHVKNEIRGNWGYEGHGEAEKEDCHCEPFQNCSKCDKYDQEALNSILEC